MTDKLSKKKYDPIAKKHVEFREAQDQVARALRTDAKKAPLTALFLISQLQP